MKSKNKFVARSIQSGLLAAFTLVAAVQAMAVGFRDPNQDPEGISRGDAMAATADNASAIYYNPAGITQIQGQQVRAGLYLISADTKFSGASGHAEPNDKFQPVPQLYYVYSMDKAPVSLGLGIYTPYGLSLDWGGSNPFRTSAIYGKLLYACINPVIAWKVLPTLSIAAGPTLNYSQATLRQGLPSPPFFPTDELKFNGDGFDAGFNAGILWQPCSQWSFGVNYRSSTEIDYKGHSETSPTSSAIPLPYYPSTPTHGSIKFPQFIVGGVSFRPTPDWNFEFDLDWTEWDKLNTAVLHGSPLGPLPIVFNYQNSFIFDFGITRQLGKGYFANVGFIYSEKSVPDKFFNPLVPDSDLYLPGVGFGYHGQRWDWAIAYHCAISGAYVIRNNINPAVDGTYKTFNNAVNVAVGLKF